MMNQSFIPKAVLFDMDGLMLDTEAPVIPFWHAVMEKHGYSMSEETVFKTIGIPASTTEKLLYEIYGSDFPHDAVIEDITQMVEDDIEKNGIPHRPGLLVLLDHLERLNIPKAVATSTRRDKALDKLKRAGIIDRFSAIVCVDDVKRGKPAPDLFLAAAEKLGKTPEQCVGFEDSSAGLQALAAAGIKSVFIKDIIQPPEEVLKTVWRRYENLAEAVELFR